MHENTDELTSNSSISEPAAEENLEQVEDQSGESQGTETTDQSITDVANEATAAAETPAKSRSERRQENYIDKLSEQIRSSSDFAPTSRQEPKTSSYQPLKYEEGDYDLDALERDRQAFGEAQASAARSEAGQEFEQRLTPLKQQVWAQQLELDNERVQKVWDVLDPEDDAHFDPEIAKEMTQKYLNFIGYKQDQSGAVHLDRPNIRWIDFVKAEKQNIDRFINRAVETSTQNVVKQAANTGVRPGAQARAPKGHNVDLTDPNWISKLSREEYDEWGRELADKEINRRLGISK